MSTWVSICAFLMAIVVVFGQSAEAQRVGDMVNQNFFRHQRFIPLFANEKRGAEEFNDPRMFSTAFGKRSSASSFDDPRMFSTAFGRR